MGGTNHRPGHLSGACVVLSDAFPDLQFTIHDVIPSSSRVSVRWSAEGTQKGDLAELPATGKRLRFAGQTIYNIVDGQVEGHWQVIDRLGFIQQLRS